MDDLVAEEMVENGGGSKTHSRESSMSSERWQDENQNKENTQNNALPHEAREGNDCSQNSGQLMLHDGGKLTEESGTEALGLIYSGFQSTKNGDFSGSPQMPEIPPRQPSGGGIGTARYKALKSGNMVCSIPEEEITIPNDGNLASFSADAMATFLRYLRLEDRLINHLHRQGMDGRKFGRLKDSDLDNLKLNNPVVVYFRDRTAPAVTKKARPRLPFVL